jgi:ribosome-binding ATPase YchF (GTP1/OBG family)
MEVTEARVRQLVSGEEFKMIWPMIASFGLLSSKPVIHVANVDEASAVDGNDLSRALEEQLKQEGCNVESEFVLVSAALEEMAATCETEELQKSFLEEYGLERTGLDAIVESCSRALNVHVFYTVGPKEARSWLIPQNASAVVAAGKIHSDFAEGFISAEVIHYQDYLNCKGEAGARKLGKQMIKGRDYVVHDGDVMHFRTTKKRD